MRKGFHATYRAYYAGSTGEDEPEIMIGDYPKGGGTHGEFAIRWKMLGDDWCPYLHAYDDSWKVLSEMQDLMMLLANYNNKSITPDQLIKELIALHYVDLTKYSNWWGRN